MISKRKKCSKHNKIWSTNNKIEGKEMSKKNKKIG